MRDEPCAFLLAGGQGSRLRPYTTVLPKPLVPVQDLPISEILMRQLRHAGFKRIIMGVNHHEGLLRSYYGDGGALGVEITYSRENRELGTVAPLHLVADRLPEHFLLLNGDLLTDLDFRRFFEAHRDTGRDLTIATYRRAIPVPDGVIEFAPDGTIERFREKPTLNFWVSMGIYAMRKSVLRSIPQDRAYGMDDLILAMVGGQEAIHTHRHDGGWYDIGCPADLERANVAFAENRHRFLPAQSQALGGVA